MRVIISSYARSNTLLEDVEAVRLGQIGNSTLFAPPGVKWNVSQISKDIFVCAHQLRTFAISVETGEVAVLSPTDEVMGLAFIVVKENRRPRESSFSFAGDRNVIALGNIVNSDISTGDNNVIVAPTRGETRPRYEVWVNGHRAHNIGDWYQNTDGPVMFLIKIDD